MKSIFLTTEKKVIKFIALNARYFKDGFRLPDGAYGGNYAVNFSNRVYHRTILAKL